jgi:hypothetical protein
MTYAHIARLCPQAGGGFMVTITAGPQLWDTVISQHHFKRRVDAEAFAASSRTIANEVAA